MTAAERLAAQVRAKALEQGRAEGQAALLLKLLARRFGPLTDAVEARIRTASAEDLDRWAEQVLGASTLDELLGR